MVAEPISATRRGRWRLLAGGEVRAGTELAELVRKRLLFAYHSTSRNYQCARVGHDSHGLVRPAPSGVQKGSLSARPRAAHLYVMSGKSDMRLQTPYDEHYSTCAYTHAWLRIMHETVDPDEITALLAVTPNEVQRRGDPKKGNPGKFYSKGGWILSTDGVLDSKDARHHLDWIIERIAGKKEAFTQLHEHGYLVDLCVCWGSLGGHGGPTVSPQQMMALADLEIELWFDVYMGDIT